MVDSSPVDFPEIGSLQVRPAPFWDAGIAHEVLSCYDLTKCPVNPGLVVDVGAHIGTFSRRAMVKWPSARVIAIEPSADNFQLLTANCPGAFLRYNKAVGLHGSDRCSYEPSYIKENTGGGGVVWGDSGDIRTVLLSDIIGEHGVIDVLKSDCEGGEWLWLEDLAQHELLGHVQYIVGELHHPEWQKEIIRYLARTHEFLKLEAVPNDDTGTLAYFTAVRKAL